MSDQDSGGATALAPLARGERIDAMDVVRGFALLGILLMNIEWFTRPMGELAFGLDGSLRGVDYQAGWLIMAFVQGKFYTMFSLLFGMGFVVFLDRARQSGHGSDLFVRRLLVLFAIGVLHGCLLWAGDILATYAVLGLLLIAWRQSAPRRLLVSAALLFPLTLGMMLALSAGMSAMQGAMDAAAQKARTAQEQQAKAKESAAGAQRKAGDGSSTDDGRTGNGSPAAGAATPATKAEADLDMAALTRLESLAAEKVYRSGSWFQVTARRSSEFLHQFFAIFLIGPNVLALFLLGAWFVRSGVMHDVDGHAGLFRALMFGGLGVGVPLALAAMPSYAHANMFEATAAGMRGMAMMYFANLLLCLGYVGTLVTLWRLSKQAPWVRALAATGRMALTNYLMHSLVLSTLFFSYGFGLWGQVPRAQQVLLALALYAFQIVFSLWWLSRYRYGPMEWAWRSATYGRAQPMRLDSE